MRGLLSDCGLAGKECAWLQPSMHSCAAGQAQQQFSIYIFEALSISSLKGHFSNNLPANPIATQDTLFFLKEVPLSKPLQGCGTQPTWESLAETFIGDFQNHKARRAQWAGFMLQRKPLIQQLIFHPGLLVMMGLV